MKRTFNDFNSNIPQYIFNLADAIRESKSIALTLPKNLGDDIDSIEYLICSLNIILNNKLNTKYSDSDDISFIYRYYSTSFNILVEYNEKKELYRIVSNINEN